MYKFIFLLLMPVLLAGHSLTVADAIGYADKGNKTILIERKTLTEDRLNVAKAISYYLPSVNLSGSWGKSGLNRPYNDVIDSSYNARISLSQPIFNYNFLENINSANIQKVMEELSFKVLKRNVEINTITKFYTVMELKSQLKAAKFLLYRSKENFDMIKRKYETGSADKTDFLKSKVDYLNAQMNFTTINSRLEVARNDFFEYIGIPQDSFVLVDNVKIDTFSLPDTDTLKSELIKYDPEIVSGRLSMQLSMVNLRRAIGAYLPSVNWNASYATKLDSFPTFSNWENGDSWSLSISVSFPVVSGGSRAIQIAEDKVAYQKSKLGYAEKVESRTNDLIAQVNAIKTAYINYKSATTANELAEQNYNLNELLYKKGSISQIKYYDAKKDFEEARANFIKSKYSFLTEKLKLDIMIGSWKGE